VYLDHPDKMDNYNGVENAGSSPVTPTKIGINYPYYLELQI